YVPRLLCWLLLGLGAIVLVQGLREAQDARPLSSADVSALRPVIFVTASLVIFGLSIERLGLVVSILLLIGVGAVAARGFRPLETLAAALVLIILSWGIFILGLGLTIPVWLEWLMELLLNLAVGFGVGVAPANVFFPLAGALIAHLIG